MTTDGLDEIESKLGVELPGAYRGAQLDYPLDRADPNSQIALMDEASSVIAFNRFLREEFDGVWLPSPMGFLGHIPEIQ